MASFEPIDAIRKPLVACGYVWRAHNTELTKRYFREQPGKPETHIHVRRSGSFDEQFALLFRDFLRVHPDSAVEYAALKVRLAALDPSDGQRYTEAKAPFIWETMRMADGWAQDIGWQPGPSDA